MSEVVELLQELIRIPSLNPQGDAGFAQTGEDKLARFTGDYLEKLGMEVEFQNVEENRPNVIGRLRSKKPKHHIILGPHLDTVSVRGMTIDPFGGAIKDGRVYGRGACDTKGSMAAIMVALNELVRSKKLPSSTDIWFTGLMGEESGNDGIAFLMSSDFFAKKGFKPDFGIAGEPTDLRIVHRHKGSLWFKVKTRGRSCHASRPDLGENAILKMQKAIDYLAGGLPKSYDHLKDPLLGKCTFSITTIRGGSKINIIPETCRVEIDHRSLPQMDHAEVIARIRQALPDCELEVTSDRPGLDTPSNNPFIQKLLGVLANHKPRLPQKDFLIGAPWFADCSLMAKGGIPAIAFGPGSIEQAHTKDEYICIDELEKGAAIFGEFFKTLD
ncbi:MAG: M20 family metallopeptidase [Verrucomicrobiae bacterium]|nr:M20 family metallopeptidase [Verrucomicrobiae bacterium]